MSGLKKKLDLLILEQLLGPTNGAASLLAEMREEIASTRRARVVTAALFALAVSQVETALVETLGYVLRRNPWKMEFSEIQSKRADVLSVELVRELLESHADELVRKWSYGSKEALFDRFVGVLELPTSTLADSKAKLTSLRDQRNRILHTGLGASNSDTQTAWVSCAETLDCIDVCLLFLAGVSAALRERYSSHTRVAALRRLWSHLFESPVMQFDRFWVVDEQKDQVIGIAVDAPINNLASSERMILGLWQAEFGSQTSLLKDFNMKHLTPHRQRDVVTLVAALRDIWVY